MSKLPTQTTPSTVKLIATTTVAHAISTIDTNVYIAVVQNDYDTDTFYVSGKATIDATQNAVNEYTRRNGIAPNSVTVTLTNIKP